MLAQCGTHANQQGILAGQGTERVGRAAVEIFRASSGRPLVFSMLAEVGFQAGQVHPHLDVAGVSGRSGPCRRRCPARRGAWPRRAGPSSGSISLATVATTRAACARCEGSPGRSRAACSASAWARSEARRASSVRPVIPEDDRGVEVGPGEDLGEVLGAPPRGEQRLAEADRPVEGGDRLRIRAASRSAWRRPAWSRTCAVASCRVARPLADERLDQGEGLVVSRQGVAGAAQLDQDVADPLVGGGRLGPQARVVASLAEEVAVVAAARPPAAPGAGRAGPVP